MAEKKKKKKKPSKRDSYEEGTGYYGPQQQPTLQENITATAPGPPEITNPGWQGGNFPPLQQAPPPQAAPQAPQEVPIAYGSQAGPQAGPPQAVPPEITNPGAHLGMRPQQGAPVEPDADPIPTAQQQAPDYNTPERSTPERHAERYSPERYGEYRPPDEKIGRNARSDEQYKSGRMDRGLELVDQEQQTLDAVFEGGSDKQRMKWKRMYDRDGSGHFDDQERQHMYHDMNQWAREKYGHQDLAGLVDEGALLRRRKEAEPQTLEEIAEEPEVIHDPVRYREEQGSPNRPWKEAFDHMNSPEGQDIIHGRRPYNTPESDPPESRPAGVVSSGPDELPRGHYPRPRNEDESVNKWTDLSNTDEAAIAVRKRRREIEWKGNPPSVHDVRAYWEKDIPEREKMEYYYHLQEKGWISSSELTDMGVPKKYTPIGQLGDIAEDNPGARRMIYEGLGGR